MNAKWTAERRFVPVHLTNGNHASSFSSLDQQPTTKSSFASENFVKTAVPVGSDPPPTASLRFPRNNQAEKHTSADISFVATDKTPQTDGFPVVVFGMPAELQQQLVDHFKQFGKLSVATNQNIECGRNFVRLIYESEDSAKRALCENGKLGPSGFMLGCVGDQQTSNDQPETSETSIKINVEPASDSLFKSSTSKEVEKTESVGSKLWNLVTTAVFGISDL